MKLYWLDMKRILLVLALTLSVTGCTTMGNRDPIDPFERVNRAVFGFNEAVDRAVLEPTARAYRRFTPSFFRTGVANVFSNVADVRNVINNSLQGKFTDAYSDFGRIVINTTAGLGGLFDVASAAGVEKNNEDFGQTLGYWGIGDGPFLMLPLLGPSSGRDVVGLAIDSLTNPLTYIEPTGARVGVSVLRVIHRRADLLDASKVVHDTALDIYLFVRDAYLQRRHNLVYDGVPPLQRDPEPK